MARRIDDPDKIIIQQRKGTWLRFIRLFPKCRLPFVWLTIYIVTEVATINFGITETDYTAQLFAGDTSAATVSKLILFMVINLIASSLVVFIRQMTSARINRNMRGAVLDKVLRLPMEFFRDEEPREAIYRIVSNSQVIDETLMLFIMPVAFAAYKAVSIFAKVFSYDVRLSIVLLAFIPVNIFIAFIFGRMNFSLSERDAAVNAGLMQKLAELVSGIPLVKAFAREEQETAEGAALTERLYRINIKGSWLDQFKEISESAFGLIQSVIMVLIGMALLGDGTINTRAWVAFFMFSSLFTGAVSEFMMYWNNIKVIQGSADRVAEIMDAPEEDKTGEPCEGLAGDIEIENLHFGYSEGQEVLSGVNCIFRDNTATALLGVSGCGKTTLVNLITRLYRPGSGCIKIGGRDISGLALDDYRKNFVMVSQKPLLFSGTVRENLCYGNGEVTDEEIEDALKRADAYGFVSAMDGGIDAVIDEYGQDLSGGQKQRLAVARALLSDAHYVILDEPVSAMDSAAVSSMLGIFRELAEGRCLIIIAHTPMVAELASDAAVIENGTVTAFGPIDTLSSKSRFMKDFMDPGKGGESDG